jgi:glycerophosphoryl diester phosphodiesterase
VPTIYAHRGGAALCPENTIAAFDRGMECGADGLEFDVHLSKDRVVVVHHDDTLERTTTGRGRLADYTADELGKVDAGCNFMDGTGAYPFRGQGIGVPTLRQVLHRYPSARLIVELKVGGSELAQRVVDEVRAADAVERVAVGSFFPEALDAVRRYEPAIATGAAKEETRWALYRSWLGLSIGATPYREFQVPEWSGWTPIVTRRFVDAAHRAGIPVKVWTVNGAADMRRLLSKGVDALITDRPDLARSIITGREPGAQV